VTGIDWAVGHEGEVEGYEANEVHEHGELICDDDELRELKELKRMVNEDGYEPQGPNSRYEETQEPPQCADMSTMPLRSGDQQQKHCIC
jgi:hypothetical protein